MQHVFVFPLPSKGIRYRRRRRHGDDLDAGILGQPTAPASSSARATSMAPTDAVLVGAVWTIDELHRRARSQTANLGPRSSVDSLLEMSPTARRVPSQCIAGRRWVRRCVQISIERCARDLRDSGDRQQERGCRHPERSLRPSRAHAADPKQTNANYQTSLFTFEIHAIPQPFRQLGCSSCARRSCVYIRNRATSIPSLPSRVCVTGSGFVLMLLFLASILLYIYNNRRRSHG